MALSSTDYKQFKLLKGNRDINQAHMAKLARSIAANPELTKARPILVNEKFEIVDGQHRFTACKQLGLPIWYEVVSDLTTQDAIALNRNQRNWNLEDFAKSYAANGHKHYQRFLEIKEEFPGFADSTLISYLIGGQQKGQTVDFRGGTFEIIDETQAIQYLGMLEDILEVTPYAKLTTVASAFQTIFKSAEYDHKRMVKKMAQWGDAQFNPYGGIADIKRSIENVYNFHQTEGGQVRLY